MNPKTRAKILFACGLSGFFGYLALTEFTNSPFHPEWVYGFLAMCGIAAAYGFDKRGD